jgi:hypothetical protein
MPKCGKCGKREPTTILQAVGWILTLPLRVAIYVLSFLIMGQIAYWILA